LHHESYVPSVLISVIGTGKNQVEPGKESTLDAPVLSHCSLIKKILDQNRLVCWSIVVKEKPTVGFPFFWAFFSDRIPKVTKDVNLHFFIYSSNCCKLHQ
jgi:hypothetical protein